MNFSSPRQHMVDCQLNTNNVYDPQILEVMGRLPRERFVPENMREIAYLDEDIDLGYGRVMMEPMVLGRMIQALAPQSNEVVLDIAGGSGYSAAVLSHLALTVIALDNSPLQERAAQIWAELELTNIADLNGDLEYRCQKNAPFDMIFINGAVAEVPPSLIMQLKADTGRLVCVHRPAGQRNGKAVLVKRSGNGDQWSSVPLFDASVPYLQEFAPKKEFTF